MTRRLLVLVCALLILVGLSGCTGDEVTGDPSTGTETSQTPTQQPSATPTSTKDPNKDPNLVATDPNKLIVGQCIHDVVFLQAPVTTVDAISCSLPHDGEVVGLTRDGDLKDSQYARAFCTQAFTDYISKDFNSSALELMFIKPGAEVSAGQLVCIAYDARGEWTASMQGSAQ